MSDNQQQYADEIDLFELVEALWIGKWWIIGITALAALTAFVYVQMSTPIYSVKVAYEPNLYSVSAQQLCGGNVNCIEQQERKKLSHLIGQGWGNDDSAFTASTPEPLPVADYEGLFDKANDDLTNAIMEEAKMELAFIDQELTGQLSASERVATNILNAKRLLNSIEQGEKAFIVGDPSISQKSPRLALTLSMAIFGGGVFAVMFVLMRNAWINRKAEQSAMRTAEKSA